MEGNFLEPLKDWFESVLGKEAQDLKFWQTMLRAFIVYVVALIIVRMGKKRLLGKNTAFDVILGIMLGSVFSRAINGNAPFLGTLTAGFIMVVLHWLFSMIAFRKDFFGHLIKGEPKILVQDGKILWESMKKHDISEKDLTEFMRLSANTEDISSIKTATLERNGNISFLKKEKQPKILEIEVKDGVQLVRVEIN
jgi:uncharacterized membrane protein YcaP (DUF421 family)